jgi:glutamine synthetase
VQAQRLPRNLLEAIEAFSADPLTAEVFHPQFISAYVAMKVDEWESYHSRVTEWERDTYLTMF